MTIYEGVITGASSAGPFCGLVNPPTYTSTSNYAGVLFQSDMSKASAGFEISYACKPKNSNCKDKKKTKKCKKWKKQGKCGKKKFWKKCKKTCNKC